MDEINLLKFEIWNFLRLFFFMWVKMDDCMDLYISLDFKNISCFWKLGLVLNLKIDCIVILIVLVVLSECWEIDEGG